MEKKNILFAIKSVKPSGGALKVRHYYEHALSYKGLNTLLYMPDDIIWNSSNPWYKYRDEVIPEIDWDIIDIVFISGWGWERFIPAKYHYIRTFKAIYLVQHPSKLMPDYDRYKDLDKPATRVCVSDALTKMANKIQHINGDVITIPAGTEIKELKAFAKKPKTINILISALKNPSMGKALKSKFETLGVKVKLLDERMDRKSFIEYVSASEIVVCLPNSMEGFYLPALEAMALNALVICPHAIGNDYCEDGKNCLVPIYTEQEIFNTTMGMLSLTTKEAAEMRKNATSTANSHDIAFEKKSFHNLLDKILKES